MKLITLINELKKLSAESDNPDDVEVRMADNIPVISPILKNGIVYITDMEK